MKRKEKWGMNKIEQVKRILRGPMIPIITCFTEDLSLDLDTIQENVRFLIKGGIITGKGVMLGGGAGGDFPMLSVDERKHVANTIVNAAEDKVPVIIGIQDTNPNVSLELAKYAKIIGAYGIQLSPPYYYKPSDSDVINFFKAINDAVQMPIMVYNTPWLGYNMNFQVLDALVDYEWVVSLKWASTSHYLYSRGIARYADRLAIVDNAGMTAYAHLLGVTGFITHLANIWPGHEVALWEQLNSGDYIGAQKEMQRVNWRWYDFRVRMGQITGGESNVVKAAYDLIGRHGGPVRPPTQAISMKHRNELKILLKEIGVPGL
jgi:dihydrodipicolinate synthase/N-acetylneuraminate lyase